MRVRMSLISVLSNTQLATDIFYIDLDHILSGNRELMTVTDFCGTSHVP